LVETPVVDQPDQVPIHGNRFMLSNDQRAKQASPDLLR
jgi:hypothetical protein